MSEPTKIDLRKEVARAMLQVLTDHSDPSAQVEAAKVLLSIAECGMSSIEVSKQG